MHRILTLAATGSLAALNEYTWLGQLCVSAAASNAHRNTRREHHFQRHFGDSIFHFHIRWLMQRLRNI